MGYGSIMFVLAAIVLGGVLVLSMESATSDADAALNTYHYDELARDAAVTGLQLTARRLADQADWGTWKNATGFAFPRTNFEREGGAFLTTVVPVDPYRCDVDPGQPKCNTARNAVCNSCSGDTVDVVARGFNGPGRQVIFARYAREKADSDIPPAFRNVITTDSLVQLNGNVNIRAIHSSINASIHTNGNLITNGNAFYVEGYGTYTRGEMTNQENNFVPNVDYNGPAPNVFWADSVHIPPLDNNRLNHLRTLAQGGQGVYIDTGVFNAPFIIDGDDPNMAVLNFANPGSLPWNGTFPHSCTGPCGTEEKPFIMFVEGEYALQFVNRVEIRGYGNIVATGNVYISPNGDGGLFGQLAEGETTPAAKTTKLLLATTRTMQVGGNACLGLGPGPPVNPDNQHCPSGDDTFTHGITLYTDKGVEFQGTPYMVGGIIAPRLGFGNFKGGGNVQIFYAAPGEAVTDPGFEFTVPIGPVLIGYSEW